MTKTQMEETGYHSAFLDCYHYLRRFADGAGDEAYWTAAAMEANDICNRYKDTDAYKLAAGILSVAYDELKRRIKTKEDQ